MMLELIKTDESLSSASLENCKLKYEGDISRVEGKMKTCADELRIWFEGKMKTCADELRIWFRFRERLVIFTFGLLFGKGMMSYVMDNLMTFLTNFWNLKLTEAAAIVNLQQGLKDMLQILVALCVDACFGYRRMLILSSVLYGAGLFLLAFSVPQFFFEDQAYCPLKKVQCYNKLKYTPFWEGLALLIVGRAAQVIPLYSLSFEQTEVVKVPRDCEPTRAQMCCFPVKVKIGGCRQLQQRIIRWLCYGFMILGTIISFNGFISLEGKWFQRFLISAFAIAMGLVWFLCGSPFYGSRRLQPSPLLSMVHVLVSAVRKRHLNYQQNSDQLHRGDDDDQKQLLTDKYQCLNNGAVKESPADDNLINKEMKWRLCTVKEVEQTKLLLNIIPMSATFIVYGMVKSIGNTYFIEQAWNMKGDIPVVVFQIIQNISKISVNKGYKVVFEKRISRKKGRYSDGMQIGFGMLASIICCAVASSIESKRLKALRQEGLLDDPDAIANLSVFWLIPQFFLLGVMEGLAGGGIENFFGHYAPDSRRYGPVFTSTLTGFGTLLNIEFIAMLDHYSKSKFSSSWFGESINQSRFDSIYRAYIMVALLNCFLYAYVATRYSYDNIIGRGGEEEEEIEFLEVKEEETATGGDEQNDQEQGNVELHEISVRN